MKMIFYKTARGFCCGLFFFFLMSAQAENVSDLPDALKGIRRADGVCKKSDFLPQRTHPKETPGKEKTNMSCALTVSALKRLMERNDATLIDIRPSKDFAVSRIDGALNTSIASIQTKPFLRNKTIVLVGNGKGEKELYESCESLRADGFKHMHILQGGMPAWLMNGESSFTRGDSSAIPPVLTESELWVESQFSLNIMLIHGEAEWKNIFPSAIFLKENNGSSLRTIMESRGWKKTRAQINAVILIVDKEVSQEELQNLQKASRSIPLLIHMGSVQNYKKQMAQQNAIWAAQARGPKQPGCGL